MYKLVAMQYICVVTLIYFTPAVISKISIGLKLNHLLLNLNTSQHNMSRVEEQWIEQPLDNFDPHEKRTFKMRYFRNLDFWKPSGPLYIFIGGESKLEPDWMANNPTLLMTQIAMETNGAIFGTEHRYYGKSSPDIPHNDKTKYYKFLSSSQALEDVANVIKMLKSDPKYKSSKVVVVGGSYAGNLAAWMRKLYPHLVDAAVASSAPVLAKKDFREYFDIVRYTFAKYGPKNCLNHVENTFKKYEEYLKTPAGREILRKIFYLPPSFDLTLLKNQQIYFGELYAEMKEAAQYGTPLAIKQVCNHYESFSKNLTLNFVHHATSNVRSGDTLNVVYNPSESNKQDDDAWTYQYCNEFGYLQTTSSEKQPFVHWNPLEYWLTGCNGFVEGDIEKRIDEGVAKTNAMYGGLTPKVSKVVFTHGDMDPWHALGVLRDLTPDAPATIVNGTSHCAVLYRSDDEPKELTENRQYVKDLIKKWIT